MIATFLDRHPRQFPRLIAVDGLMTLRETCRNGPNERRLSMPKVLSEEQVDRFHREAFIATIPVLSADEVARYREHLK